jgi:hypothetical protein
VGIGESSPSGLLHLKKASDTADIILESSGGSGKEYLIGSRTDGSLNIYDVTAGAERIRIDSSGNLLVGGTSAFGADTITLGTGGFAGIRNTSGSCLELRRDSTDGSIIDFQKDGSTVGSIGTNVGRLSIGSGDAGVLFAGDIDAIYPANGIAARDSAIDLGVAGARFKDLYLSGGVYLGGTGAANKLDDYEEGTWTPTYTDDSGNVITNLTSQGGSYVKVGNLVYISGNVRTQSSSSASGLSGFLSISGLPFTQSSGTAGTVSFYTHVSVPTYNAPSELPRTSPLVSNTTRIAVYKYSGTGGRTTRFEVSDLNMSGNSNFMFFSGTYGAS